MSLQDLKNAIEYKAKFVGEISEEIKIIEIVNQIERKEFQNK